MTKKSKAIVLELQCNCGKKWTAAYPTGKVRAVAKCPACANYIKTDGSGKPKEKPSNCAGCKRPLFNNHHCTYCGRPVNEKAAQKQISKDARITFCTEDNEIKLKKVA